MLFRAVLWALWFCFGATATWAAAAPSADEPAGPKQAQHLHARPGPAPIDPSGKIKKGKASYYSRRLSGKIMADGKPLNPGFNAAASRTLPLGNTAKVTNLANGRSAVVEIEDRGPYVPNRIVDVTPKTAQQLGMSKPGVAPVAVAPIKVPQADGTVRKGEGADESR